VILEEDIIRAKELERAGESLLDEHTEFQEDLENADITNDNLNQIRELLIDSLHTLNVQQVTIDISRKTVEDQLTNELSEFNNQELDVTRYAKEYLEKTRQIELLQLKELSKLKKAVTDILMIYNEYEQELKSKNITKTFEKKKMIKKFPKMISQDKSELLIAELIVEYEEAKKVEDPIDKNIKIKVLKKQFKNCFRKIEEANTIFEQLTEGDTL